MKDFGQRLRRMRMSRELELNDLAVRARMPWATLAAIETGRQFPSLFDLERILRALEVTLNDIMSFEH